MPHDLIRRFHDDPAFRALAQHNAHAALQSAGIAVPAGVSVDILAGAARAVDKCLDEAMAQASPVLDDALLAEISGGVNVTAGEVQGFLGHLRNTLTG